MTTTNPESPELAEVLSRQRIASAFGALSDPSRGATDQALCLSEDEREVIKRAMGKSPHPLVGFASQLIDQWDQAAADDRIAGLLLFAEITSGHTRQQDTELHRGTGPHMSR